MLRATTIMLIESKFLLVILVTLRRGPPGNRNQTEPAIPGIATLRCGGRRTPNARPRSVTNAAYRYRVAIATKLDVVAVPLSGVTGRRSIGWPSTRIVNRKHISSEMKRT